LAATPHDAADQDVQKRNSAKENHSCHLTFPKTKEPHFPSCSSQSAERIAHSENKTQKNSTPRI